MLLLSDVLFVLWSQSVNHITKVLALNWWPHVTYSIYEPSIFPFLPQTEYAISRACHCGCHFRMLPQQSPTSTKVNQPHPSALYKDSLVCQLLHQFLLFVSFCFIPSIWTTTHYHSTCKCRHVFIDRHIHQMVNILVIITPYWSVCCRAWMFSVCKWDMCLL